MGAATPQLELGLDFRFYWAAARVLLEGGNPYDHGTFASAVYRAGFPAGFEVPWYPYLPSSLLWLLPFALLPYKTALLAWYAVLAAGFIMLFRASGRLASRLTGRAKTIDRTLLACCFPPVLRAALLGQIAILLSGLLILSIERLARGRHALAGLLLSLSIFKPQLSYLIVPVLIIGSLRAKALSFALAFLGGLAAQMVAIELLRPGIWSEYWVFSLAFGSSLASVNSKGLTAWIGPAAAMPLLLFFSCVVTFGASLLAWNGTLTLPRILLLLLPLSLLAAPYGWIHDQLVLLPAVFSLGALARARFGSYGLLMMTAGMGALLFTIPGSIIEYAYALLPLAVLAAYGAAHAAFRGPRVFSGPVRGRG